MKFNYNATYNKAVDADWVKRQFRIYDQYAKEHYDPKELLNNFDGTSYNSLGNTEYNIIHVGTLEKLDVGGNTNLQGTLNTVGGATIGNIITLKNESTANGAAVKLNSAIGKSSTVDVLKVNRPSSSTNYGNNVSLGANGNTIISSGEYGSNSLFDSLKTSTNENLYLSSDIDVNVMTNANGATAANTSGIRNFTFNTKGCLTVPGILAQKYITCVNDVANKTITLNIGTDDISAGFECVFYNSTAANFVTTKDTYVKFRVGNSNYKSFNCAYNGRTFGGSAATFTLPIGYFKVFFTGNMFWIYKVDAYDAYYSNYAKYSSWANNIINKNITIQTGSTKQSKITLQTLISWLITKGYVPNNTASYVAIQTSWSYASNDILQLNIDGTNYELQLAGVIIEVIGNVKDYKTGLFRLRIHSSPTIAFTVTSGYVAFPVDHIAEYTCNGDNNNTYSPSWRMLRTSTDVVEIKYGGTGATSAIGAEYNILNHVADSTEGSLTDDRKIALCNTSKSATNGVFRWVKLSVLYCKDDAIKNMI
jgi:hypothetical protein